MKRYYTKLHGVTNFDSKSGTALEIPDNSYELVSRIISAVTFSQSLIQRIVLLTYAHKIEEARLSLRELTSPTSRLNFLNAFSEIDSDPIVYKILRYAKELFSDVYLLRNALVHETWLSSQKYPDCILLSSLSEEARLQNASGELIHSSSATSANTYNTITRYIGSVRSVTPIDLHKALADMSNCNWCLMQIDFIIKQSDKANKDELKKAFLVFKGVSHLFEENERVSESINWSSSAKHSIEW